MRREQHLKFCKKCIHRKNNLQVGLLCGLTGKKADFENECSSYVLDESVMEQADAIEAVEHNDMLTKLSEKDMAKFKSEQNYMAALASGIVVGVLGAIVWGAVTVSTGYQIGYIAIAIGAAVGMSMRFFGKGMEQVFGVTGGLVALLSCLLGNFFSIIGFVANTEGLGYVETLMLFDYGQLIPVMSEAFSPMDLIFYGIAAFEGYKFSFRTFTERDLLELEK